MNSQRLPTTGRDGRRQCMMAFDEIEETHKSGKGKAATCRLYRGDARSIQWHTAPEAPLYALAGWPSSPTR